MVTWENRHGTLLSGAVFANLCFEQNTLKWKVLCIGLLVTCKIRKMVFTALPNALLEQKEFSPSVFNATPLYYLIDLCIQTLLKPGQL